QRGRGNGGRDQSTGRRGEHPRVSTILIVDDEEIHARALGRFLGGRGHACEVATSHAAAVEALRTARPHLVLLDLRVGEVDGLAAGEQPTVLLQGETGTGKDLVARILHARSTLAREAFIALDCSTLQRNLIEAELFGYERGAFTHARAAKRGLVEVAAGGTLFLDEIGELDHEAQGK